MKNNSLPSRPAVSSSKADVCPECKHRMDDYSLSHYPDCRYFWIDSDPEEELDIALTTATDKLRAASNTP